MARFAWNRLAKLALWLPIAGLAFAAPPVNAPDYKVIEQWPIPNGGFGKTVLIKANPGESEMRMLGDRLREDTKSDRNAFIFIYDDEQAARNRRAASASKLSDNGLRHHDRHRVGTYLRNANTGFHELDITTKGLDGPDVKVTY